MNETKHTQIRPREVFKVTATRTVKHDSRTKMHRKFAHTVEANPSRSKG